MLKITRVPGCRKGSLSSFTIFKGDKSIEISLLEDTPNSKCMRVEIEHQDCPQVTISSKCLVIDSSSIHTLVDIEVELGDQKLLMTVDEWSAALYISPNPYCEKDIILSFDAPRDVSLRRANVVSEGAVK